MVLQLSSFANMNGVTTKEAPSRKRHGDYLRQKSSEDPLKNIENIEQKFSELTRDYCVVDKDDGRRYYIVEDGPKPRTGALVNLQHELMLNDWIQDPGIRERMEAMKIKMFRMLNAPRITWDEERKLAWSYGGIYQPHLETFRPQS